MTQQRSGVTRKRILAAALVCFSEKGYDASAVADICESAGVSKGAFYHHFPTKQAIFLALLSDWLGELEARLLPTRDGEGSVPETLAHMADLSGGVFSAASGQLPLFLEFWIQAKRDPAVWNETIEPYHHYQQIFAGLIQSGITEGSLRPVSPDVTAKVIVSLAVGLLLQSVLDPKGGDWGQVAREGIEVLLDGLRKETP